MNNPATPDPITNELNYESRPNSSRNKWIYRISMVMIILSLSLMAYKWGPSTYKALRVLQHQRACLNYVAPSDQVVFETNPQRVALLASDPNYVISGGCAYRKSPDAWTALRPPALPGKPGLPTPPAAVIYLHEMTIAGERRLIAVERSIGASYSPHFIAGYDIEICNQNIATFKNPVTTEKPMMYAIDVMDSIKPKLDLRIYAAQPDPKDASRFTIKYEQDGISHTVDAHATDNGWFEFNRRGE